MRFCWLRAILAFVKIIKVLRGGVKVPTGGIVRELLLAADPVGFRNQQYSLDERRMCGRAMGRRELLRIPSDPA